jgi:AcrR family transcriptional regulator
MTLHRRTRSARGSGTDLRAEIIAATRRLMSETGHADAVTIRAVARAVGVTAPSIYRHFAD